ncbi:hypothetical protein [Spirilliplanes yamanashiensis]|uniref:Uncharacterized protein n=1 Tax=Spirilliplanes yamanashiensis TaxID=42233 RepID=A0A8J3Y6V6_9ACTN|nr:hypothetical protein [Spirilliplanes yamanashiensis]MDP9814814.1 hypothetical protein [Spirilliplanes yamanashiensis]GIJ02469.1 hypothetical protein Sya03_18210 [Spirilliplanes yamanashiensis]
MSQVNVYALLTTLGAVVVAAAVLAGSMAYRARQRRTGRLGRLEDAVIGRQIEDLAAGSMAPEEATRMLRELRYLPGTGVAGAYRPTPSPWQYAMSFPESESGASRLGYRLFKWLLILAFFLLVGLMGYAWWTYPTTADATALLPAASGLDARLEAIRELRRDWLQQVKDLGQMFVLTPVVPLIAAVVGYLFGVRRSTPSGQEAQAPSAPAVATEAELNEENPDGAVAEWAERNLAKPQSRRGAARPPAAAPAFDPEAVLAAAGGKPARRLSAGRRKADTAAPAMHE